MSRAGGPCTHFAPIPRATGRSLARVPERSRTFRQRTANRIAMADRPVLVAVLLVSLCTAVSFPHCLDHPHDHVAITDGRRPPPPPLLLGAFRPDNATRSVLEHVLCDDDFAETAANRIQQFRWRAPRNTVTVAAHVRGPTFPLHPPPWKRTVVYVLFRRKRATVPAKPQNHVFVTCVVSSI